jgi:hypothetical protein
MGYWDVHVHLNVFHRGELASYLTRYSAGKFKITAIDWLKWYVDNNDESVLIIEVKVAHKVVPTAELIAPMGKGHTMQCVWGRNFENNMPSVSSSGVEHKRHTLYQIIILRVSRPCYLTQNSIQQHRHDIIYST